MKKFINDESGATAIEYGLIAAAMGLMLVIVMPILPNTPETAVAKIGITITSIKPMAAAMRPYSIAVAPDSSLMNFFI